MHTRVARQQHAHDRNQYFERSSSLSMPPRRLDFGSDDIALFENAAYIHTPPPPETDLLVLRMYKLDGV